MTAGDIPFQRELFDGPSAAFDALYEGVRQIELDAVSWVEHAERWVQGADALFDEILRARDWKQRTRRMYDRRVI